MMLGSYLEESKQQYGHQDKGVTGQQPPPSLSRQREENESGCNKPLPRQQPLEPETPAIISVIEIENDHEDDNIDIELTLTTCRQDVTESEALFIKEVRKLNTASQEQEGALTSSHDDPSTSNDIVVITDRPSIASSLIEEKLQPIATPVTPDCDRTHKITVTTASSSYPTSIHSTTSSITNSHSDISSINKAYQQYKQTKSRSPCLSSESSLHEIIEDIQFCGMYFMKELFDDEDTDDEEEDNQNKISKVERVKETNESFLGKIIQCTSSVHISRNQDLSTTIIEDELTTKNKTE